LLDADIYGPSLPIMQGLAGEPLRVFPTAMCFTIGMCWNYPYPTINEML